MRALSFIMSSSRFKITSKTICDIERILHVSKITLVNIQFPPWDIEILIVVTIFLFKNEQFLTAINKCLKSYDGCIFTQEQFQAMWKSALKKFLKLWLVQILLLCFGVHHSHAQISLPFSFVFHSIIQCIVFHKQREICALQIE